MPKTVSHGSQFTGLKNIKSANLRSPKESESLQSAIFTTTDKRTLGKYSRFDKKMSYDIDTSKISSLKNIANIGKDKVISSNNPPKKLVSSLDTAIKNAGTKREARQLNNFKNPNERAKELLDRTGLVKTEKMQVEATGGVVLMPPKQVTQEDDDS